VRRVVASIAGLVVLALAGPASASKITLTMSTVADPSVKQLTITGDTPTFSWYGDIPVQVYEATLTADDGSAIGAGCLSRARLEIMDAQGRIRGGVACADADGVWRITLTTTRVKEPTPLSVRVANDATTDDGRTVSAAMSNTIITTIAPRIVLAAPTVSRSARYPVRGTVKIPTPRKLGKTSLQCKDGRVWTTVASGKTDARGRFSYSVTRGARGTRTSCRITYSTVKTTLWSSSTYAFTISWV
jgi:hypothetical protein